MPFVDRQGIKVHYELEGDGPPLVLQHGFSNSLEGWYDNGCVAALRSDYRLILMDARGHGGSDKPHDSAAYGLPTMADDVIGVMDGLGIGRANYWGYSMGGAIGFCLAREAPERFLSFILGGSHPYRRSACDPAPVDTYGERIAALRQGGMEAYVAWTESQTGPIPPKRKASLLASDANALAAVLATLRDAPRLDDVPSRMTAPCLLYAGQADPVYPGVKKCARDIRGSTFVSIPGLNHPEVSQRGDLIVGHARQFLSSVAQPGRV